MKARDMHPTMVRFGADETGGVAVWSVLWLAVFLALGGVAVDVSNAYRVRAQLQAAVDAAALGGATRIPDEADARQMAILLARRNLPTAIHGEAVTAADVRLGAWNDETGEFEDGVEPMRAIWVTARQTEDTGNPVRTWLLPLVGFDAWNMAATSVAVARMGPGGAAGPVGPCVATSIVSTMYLSLGAGNTFLNGVCLHGQTGVQAGGNDFFSPDVRITAKGLGNIEINSLRPGSAAAEDIAFDETQEAQIVPRLGGMFDDLWDAIWDDGSTTYDGNLLPDFVSGAGGSANVVRVNQASWMMRAADVAPHTIYLVDGDVSIANGVDLRTVAVLARGEIEMLGAGARDHSDVMLFAQGAMNLAGRANWGDETTYCDDGGFGIYLLSLDEVVFTSNGSASGGLFGAMIAAPDIDPGKMLENAGGLFIEATEWLQTPGNARVTGCNVQLSDELGLDIGPGVVNHSPPVVIGAYLVR